MIFYKLIRKYLFISLILTSILYPQNKVYINPDELYLNRIAILLEQNNYRIFLDSTKVDWVLELKSDIFKDSVRNEVWLSNKSSGFTQSIGAFNTEKLANKDTKTTFRKYILWNMVMGFSLSLLFFIRT